MTDLRSILIALEHLKEDQIWPFLSRLNQTDVIEVINSVHTLGSQELRNKVGIGPIISKTIEAAKEDSKKPESQRDVKVQMMLNVSISLLKSDLERSINKQINLDLAVEYCLQVYDYLQINKNNQGLADTILRSCGKSITMKNLRSVLDQVNVLVTEEEKRYNVRNFLCSGYIERNGAELAFVALENDPILSRVTAATVSDGIINALEWALDKGADEPDLERKRAHAIFWRACHFPGMGKAKGVVSKCRPELLPKLIG